MLRIVKPIFWVCHTQARATTVSTRMLGLEMGFGSAVAEVCREGVPPDAPPVVFDVVACIVSLGSTSDVGAASSGFASDRSASGKLAALPTEPKQTKLLYRHVLPTLLPN